MNKATTNARVTELDTLSDTIVRLYKADAALAEDALLKDIMAELERQSALITTAIKRDAVSSNLEAADATRDNAVRDLGTLVEGYTAIPFAEQKEAAATLNAAFGKYGKKIVQENYASESSLIESLLEDFAALSAEQEKLPGVAELAKSLREAQDAFNAANDEYTKAKADKGESASSLKKPLAAALNGRLVPYLSLVAQMPSHKAFVAQVDAEIKKLNDAVVRRK